MSKALENGIAVLEYISTKRVASVTEIAGVVGLNKSTVSRIIQTFVKYNMVELNKISKMYEIGPAMLKMSSRYYAKHNFIKNIKSIMLKISREIGESVHLCTLSNDSAVVVEQIEGVRRLVVNAKIGNREPLHASSVGKCLLAFAPEEEIESILIGYNYEIFTKYTISNEQDFLKELEKIRTIGYAVDENELSEDIKCVAVPIFDEFGVCKYALGISGANSHMSEEVIPKLIEKMKAEVKALRREL